MIQSMTGFGSSANDDFTVEIRSLNHRHIDISLKLPPFMNQYEVPLRNKLKERFQRGKFDITIATNPNKTARLKIDKDLARSIYASLKELKRELDLSEDIRIETLMAYKEILIQEQPEYDIDSLFSVFSDAVSHLEKMRTKEGSLLQGEIVKRAHQLREMNKKMKSLSNNMVPKWQEKLTERLKLFLDDNNIDNDRILQETVIMADKLDISEETNRIENHLIQLLETINNDMVIGKRLDFILQEIGREVNTASYKSSDYSISSLVVDMKTEIEKMREQVQNIQ